MSLFEDVFILILFSGEFMVIFVVLFLGGKQKTLYFQKVPEQLVRFLYNQWKRECFIFYIIDQFYELQLFIQTGKIIYLQVCCCSLHFTYKLTQLSCFIFFIDFFIYIIFFLTINQPQSCNKVLTILTLVTEKKQTSAYNILAIDSNLANKTKMGRLFK